MKRIYKVLIIDDERLARNDLKSLLSEHDNIQITGEAEDVSTAIEAIQNLDPDVIFLDIQMPGDSGFDLLEKVDIRARIIFVTAFDEYAIRAFEVNALDYLLKPVHPDRLARTIERLELEEEAKQIKNRKLAVDDRLFLTLDNRLLFIQIGTILSIQSAGDYSEILTKDGKKGLTNKTMKEWEYRLPDKCFARIHRSTIINLDDIDRIEEWFNNAYRIYLKGIEKPYVMSRRYSAKLKNRFG